MVFRSIVFLACAAVLLAGMPSVSPTVMAQGSGGNARIILQTTLPDSNQVKFPDVAATSATNTVHVSGNANRDDANYWSKPDTGGAFPEPTRLGDAPGQSDFSSTAIAVDPQGNVHYAWINQSEQNINYRFRPATGDWGPTRVIVSGGGQFRVNLDLAVSSDGTIFAAWRAPDTPVLYRLSTDNGASWRDVGDGGAISERAAFGFPSLAAGPNGEIMAAYTQTDGDLLNVYVAEFTGSGWNRQQVSLAGQTAAGPSATISGTGVRYVAWRAVEGGLFFAERQPDGSWPVSRLVNDPEIFDPVNILADAQNNLHIFWISNINGPNDLYYAFRPAGDNFAPQAVQVSSAGRAIFNGRASTNLVGAQSYGHVVLEAFSGSGLQTQYYLFAADGAASISARPVIAGDAPIIGTDEPLEVAFTNISGTPNQVRWRWGAPPNDTESDSNGWQPFANPLSVPVPESLRNSETCLPARLYTQVRNTTLGIAEAVSKVDDVTLDNGLQLSISLRNPYVDVPALAELTGTAALEAIDLAQFPGAEDGDPNYTRAPVVFVEIDGRGECSGLLDFTLGIDTSNLGTPYAINNNYFANFIPLPDAGDLAEGAIPLIVRIRDNAGNQEFFPFTIIYDRSAPVVDAESSGTEEKAPLEAGPGSDGSALIVNLDFTNIAIEDNLYPNSGIWGLWIANSRTLADPLLPNLALNWQTVPVRSTGNTFTVPNWSLAGGLPANEITPGTYYVIACFMDGAGNVSNVCFAEEVDVNSVALPRDYLPFLQR
jgi:hypothetical protein